MWVVKLGGSLNNDPLLPEWLELLAKLGGGRVTIVCGGGAFADEVRRAQAHWHFSDLAAHNMAVLAMAQSAYLAHGLAPSLRLAASQAEIRHALHSGATALWLPFAKCQDKPGEDTNWDVSADSLALELARELNAERLVIVKACKLPHSASLADLSGAGILDRRFASAAAGAACAIDVIQRSELAQMRSLLLGESRGAQR
jgi:5-(aminomethyl)-3-furanmethanol phosphate kinase